MKISYRTDLYGGYMLVEIPQDADMQSYSFKMLENNKIKGVLPCKIRMEDGKGYLYNDITNKRSLTEIYKDKEMQLEDMLYIFQHLLTITDEVKNFLLTEKMICFLPQYIYQEEEEESLYILILPWQEEAPKFQNLAEFFLEKINHRDEHGVNAAYHFYRQQSKNPFSLSQFLPVLEKENILKRQKNTKEEPLLTAHPTEENVMDIVEEMEEEGREERKNTSGKLKYVFLLCSFLTAVISFLEIIPYTLKLSLRAFALLFLFLSVYFIFFSKKESKEEKPEEETRQREEWDVGETVFFAPDDEEEWKLKWKEKGRTKQMILKDFPCKVGKLKEEADIVIKDPSVSRLHCQFIKKENHISIMDLNSTNGTRLNGLPIKNNEIMEIAKNDEILIGKVRILVV